VARSAPRATKKQEKHNMQTTKEANTKNWQQQIKEQNFTWATFHFTLQAKERSFLPEYKGSTLRGGFGHSFRRVCCTVRDQDCKTCMLNQSCPYAYIFETPKVSGMKLEHQADNLPHPFVIEPPLTEQTEFQAGDEFEIGLVLFGKSVSFLPYFVYTFDQMGRMGLGKGRGKFELTSVYAANDPAGQQSEQIYDFKTQMLNGNFKTWKLADILSQQPLNNGAQLNIDLLTPTRILNQNRIVNQVPFDLLMRNILRRISLLGQIHCESRWELPYKEILDQAASQVKLVDRTRLWEDRGTELIVPFDISIPEGQIEPRLRACLQTRNYIGELDNGQASYVDCRFVTLKEAGKE